MRVGGRLGLGNGLLGVVVLLGMSPSVAALARLDPSFGRDGRVTTNFTDGYDAAFGVAIQSDGKVLAVGTASSFLEFAVARFNPDGTLDSTFDGDGRVTTNFPEACTLGCFFGEDEASGVAIDSDGRSVVAGHAGDGSMFALARYDTDGSLDSDFDGDGRVTTDLDPDPDLSEFASALALQPDGKIVVVGAIGQERFVVVRYLVDGSLDPDFGVGGVVDESLWPGDEEPGDLAIQADGKIVVVGHSRFELFSMARFNADGSLDGSFSGDGKLRTNFLREGEEGASGVGLQENGKIVLGGFARGFALARYTTNGILDPRFSQDGKTVVDFTQRVDAALGLGIDPEGRIVAGGYALGRELFAVARFRRNGNLDRSFGGDGKVTTRFRVGPAAAWSLAIQGNGKIVLAGNIYNARVNDYRFALARYRGR